MSKCPRDESYSQTENVRDSFAYLYVEYKLHIGNYKID